jgi:hypothetical protein
MQLTSESTLDLQLRLRIIRFSKSGNNQVAWSLEGGRAEILEAYLSW